MVTDSWPLKKVNIFPQIETFPSRHSSVETIGSWDHSLSHSSRSFSLPWKSHSMWRSWYKLHEMKLTVAEEAVMLEEIEVLKLRLLTMLYQSHQRNQDGGLLMAWWQATPLAQVGSPSSRYQIAAALRPTSFPHHLPSPPSLNPTTTTATFSGLKSKHWSFSLLWKLKKTWVNSTPQLYWGYYS